MHKLLLITNHQENIDVLFDDFILENFNISYCLDAFSALKKMNSEVFDYLIYDLDSPGLDFLNTIKIARNIQKNISIILLASENNLTYLNKIKKFNPELMEYKTIQINKLESYLIEIIDQFASDTIED